MEMVKARIQTSSIVAPGQIGWVFYQEGDAEIALKVVRGRDGYPFLATPCVRRDGVTVNFVNYHTRTLWNQKRKDLLKVFREQVGEEYYRNFKAPIPLRD